MDINFELGTWKIVKRVKKLQGINPHQGSYIDLEYKRTSKWWGFTQEAQDERQKHILKNTKS